jgi:K+-transporting ATPase ATPase C chain
MRQGFGTTLGRAARFALVWAAVCGLLYPLAVTGLAGALFPRQAGGSLVRGADGRVAGSALLGQRFTSPRHFHGRLSATGYDASQSGASNLAPSDPELARRVRADVARWERENPGVAAPADLVTASASGLDPDLTPAGARAQVRRVSRATGIPEVRLEDLVRQHTVRPALGFLGEARVNVLQLNQAVGRLAGR